MISIEHLEHVRDVATAHGWHAESEGRDVAAREWYFLADTVQKRIERRQALPTILLVIASTVALVAAAWSGSAIANFQ